MLLLLHVITHLMRIVVLHLAKLFIKFFPAYLLTLLANSFRILSHAIRSLSFRSAHFLSLPLAPMFFQWLSSKVILKTRIFIVCVFPCLLDGSKASGILRHVRHDMSVISMIITRIIYAIIICIWVDTTTRFTPLRNIT